MLEIKIYVKEKGGKFHTSGGRIPLVISFSRSVSEKGTRNLQKRLRSSEE